MKYRLLAGFIALASGTFLWWFASTRPQFATASGFGSPLSVKAAAASSAPTPAATSLEAATAGPADSTEDSTVEETISTVPAEMAQAKRAVTTLAAAEEPSDGPELAPGLTPVTVLENMRTVFRQYTLRFGANPVGNNLEITQALGGGNPRQVNFLQPDDGQRLNARGELVDNWGTPYFFHQVSGSVMEIHSAGPDRRLWTADDLVIK